MPAASSAMVEIKLDAGEQAAFDKSCDAVRKLIEDFKKLDV